MQKSFIFIFLFCCSFLTLQAQVELRNEQDSYVVGKSIAYLRDPAGELTLTNILSKDADFVPSNKESMSFGFTKDVIWIKFLVKNQSDYQDWILNLDVHYINYLNFYYQEKEDWKKLETGNFLPFDTKQINHIGFAFPLKNPAKSEKTYYVRLKSESPLALPIYIERYERFTLSTGLQKLYYGGYFGILLVMILYNIFIYVSLGDKNYLYYVLTIIATLAVFSSSTGYAFMLIWPKIPALNVLPTRVFMSLTVITTAIFSIHFLQLKKYAKFLYYWMLCNIVLAVLASLLHQFTPIKSLTNSIISLHIVALVIAGIITWRKGNPLAKYYFFAWFFYLLGGSLITFRNNGLFSNNLFTDHAAEVGSILEVIIISFALGEKYRIFKREKELANKKALQIQKEANEELETKVHERTAELQTTLEVISKQNLDIEKKNNNINASINYASRIQEAFLAIDNEIKKDLPEHFIFFKPRDLVSGDFYFFAKKGTKIIIAAGDCTGHGVPGAMMSMIGEAYLSQIIHLSGIISVNEILSELHQKIRTALLQGDDNYAIGDGMDIAVCVIDKHTKTLEFAGAKRPLVYIQNNEIQMIKGTRLGIGGRRGGNKLRTFEKHKISFNLPTTIYLFTDGFQDQFGGVKDRKFMIKNLKKLFLDNHQKTLKEQELILESTFESWKGDSRQIDDVLIIGFKLDESF